MRDVVFPLAVALAAGIGAAFFGAAETSAFLLGDADLRRADSESPRAAVALRRLAKDRRRVLAAVLLINLGFSVLFFAVTEDLAAALGLGGAAAAAAQAAFVLAFVALAEILPKTAALRRPLRMAEFAAWPLLVAVRALAAPCAVLTALARGLRRIMPEPADEGAVTPAELARILEISASQGRIERDEHDRLHALVMLDQIGVREVMTPRVDMDAFDLRGGRAAFSALFSRSRRNKIPTYDRTVDKISGYLDAKDVIAGPPDAPLESFVRPVGFMPETATVADAVEIMRKTGGRLLIVVDEYGGVEGLVTREDLAEAIVGDLSDESETRWTPVQDLGGGRFLVDAALPVSEARRVFGLKRVVGAHATLGGLVVAALGRLPREGDEVRLGAVVASVAAMRGRRVQRLVVRHAQGGAP